MYVIATIAPTNLNEQNHITVLETLEFFFYSPKWEYYW